MIGNKAELEEEREITFDRACEFARAHKISKCFETSAKTGNNVEDVFGCAIKEVYKNQVKDEGGASKTVQPGSAGSKPKAPPAIVVGDGGTTPKNKEKKGGCC